MQKPFEGVLSTSGGVPKISGGGGGGGGVRTPRTPRKSVPGKNTILIDCNNYDISFCVIFLLLRVVSNGKKAIFKLYWIALRNGSIAQCYRKFPTVPAAWPPDKFFNKVFSQVRQYFASRGGVCANIEVYHYDQIKFL